MDISELRRITQYSRDSVHKEIWFAPVLRFFSIYITKLLIHTKITPNQVTLMSASVGVVGGICFSFGSGVPSILGSFFLLLALLLDCVDGEVARYKKMSSLTGLTFDMFAQNVIFISALVGISIGCWKESGSSFSIIGFLTAILFLLSAHLSLSTFTVAAKARLSNQFSRVNVTNMDEKIVNEPDEKKSFCVS